MIERGKRVVDCLRYLVADEVGKYVSRLVGSGQVAKRKAMQLLKPMLGFKRAKGSRRGKYGVLH